MIHNLNHLLNLEYISNENKLKYESNLEKYKKKILGDTVAYRLKRFIDGLEFVLDIDNNKDLIAIENFVSKSIGAQSSLANKFARQG